MELPWDHRAWKPTAGAFEWSGGHWEKPSKKEFVKLRGQLATTAKKTRDNPHEARFRFQRGKTLYDLGYPELAAGDYEKTLMLIEYGLDFSSDLGEDVRVLGLQKSATKKPSLSPETAQQTVSDNLEKLRKKTYLNYVDAVYATRAYPDMIEICKEALENYPGDPDIRELLGGSECVYSEYVKKSKTMLQAQGETLEDSAWGMIATKSYPWAPPEIRTRTAETMIAANKMLESYSDCLEIRPSALGGPKAITQCFGMFAKRDIKENERILNAPTAAGVANKPVTGQYCYNCASELKMAQVSSFSCCPSMKFCGKDCLQIAEDNYHKALCGKDFSDLYQAASSQDPQESSKGRDSLVFLRLIAISIQSGTHPLMTPPISWLVANDESPSPIPWSRGANITGPLKAIQKLGLDIFAEEYDTWVLQTMWYRVMNNARTHNTTVKQKIVNPLYSLFNHSCEPSTMDQTDLSLTISSTSRAVMIATKDIKAGEEVYDTYLNPMYLSAPKAIRQKEMERGGWLDARGCKCRRCLAER